VAENGSISPQWHHTTFEHRGDRLKSNHGQTMAELKKFEELGPETHPNTKYLQQLPPVSEVT